MRYKSFVWAAAVVATFSVAAIPAAISSGANAKTFTIGISNPNASNPILKAWQDAIAVKARSYGMRVISVDAALSLDAQISGIDSLLQRKVNALIVSPVDPKSIDPEISKARAKGIIVIGYDSGSDPLYAANFTSNYFAASRASAFYLQSHLGNGAEVAALTGFPQVPALQLRNLGFLAGAKAAGLQVVDAQLNPKDSADGARPIVDGWKTKYGSALKGIWSYNDPGALGAVSAADSSFKPMVISMSASDEGIAQVRAGSLTATWDQRPIDIGNGMAYAIHEALVKHVKLPRQIVTPMIRYDKTNVAKWKATSVRLRGPENVKFVKPGKEWLLVVVR